MAAAAVQLHGRLRSLPFFLAVWILSYVAPRLVETLAELVARVGTADASPVATNVGLWIVWLALLPGLFAWAQWLLMRRCVSTAMSWAIAVFAGALLARLGMMLIDDLDLGRVLAVPALFQVFDVLDSAFGTMFAAAALTVLPLGLWIGAAMAIPQAVVLPGSILMRIVWIAVMIPTGYASTALGEGLFRTVQTAMVTLAASPGLFVALAFAPRICAWLLAAVVSGLLMHAILRRRAGSASGQLYARFD